ncbi:MAG: Lrp/AsnC family transcriptional regulator [Theionarchaea archaeon]|nr:Lrp/AsnC family transcriptional regulator [Theionarchaea archaeon]
MLQTGFSYFLWYFSRQHYIPRPKRNIGDVMVIAFILLTTTPGKEEEIATQITEKEAVKECHVVYGEYDIHLTVETSELHELDEFVHELRLLEGIDHSITLISTGA